MYFIAVLCFAFVEDVNKMVSIGSGAERNILDLHLSRYACYLTIQNAGIIKPVEYAIFQNWGYKGLYNGLDAKGIHKNKDLKKNRIFLTIWEAQSLLQTFSVLHKPKKN